MNHSGRRDKLRRQLKTQQLDALLVTNFVNVTYLTGFTGDDSYLLVTADNAIIISDLRYDTQLHDECPDVELCIRGPGTKMLDFVKKAVESSGARRIGFEADSMTVALRDAVGDALPKAELCPTSGLVEELRMIKDKDEIARTRVACDQARRAMEVVRAGITPETTENQIAADLEYQTRRFGGKGLSFTPIVGVGYRAALPHGVATDRKVAEDDFVLIDWGANEGLYISDLTRVWVTGKITAKFRKLYNLVLKAQLAGIAAIKPGVACEAVDAAARKVIEKAGHGKAFGHGLGHGTGLEVHEAPRLAKGQKTELKPGMIVTVEPGIYFPDWGGIRIEDDVLVTRNGHEVLSNVPKKLEECVVG